MAHFRWSEENRTGPPGHAQSRREIRHEVAECCCCAEFANVAGIDMAQAVQEKMAINAEALPGAKLRGTARKYDRWQKAE